MNGVELQIWEQRERDKQPDWLEDLLRYDVIRIYDVDIDRLPSRIDPIAFI